MVGLHFLALLVSTGRNKTLLGYFLLSFEIDLVASDCDIRSRSSFISGDNYRSETKLCLHLMSHFLASSNTKTAKIVMYFTPH